ncbi:hypothetical protein D1013_15845 [Euzebyella marina]|uniref:Lipocalin-like domain-containing protein n=1 Tax=Euzebyella marina TaxID=1761453 RepID=A0A3G2L918_9FLAO|nr:hypothetical protein [Euzebyella marina]AYN68746.1 hypothetical protein D1013_15845 [Euzebyella marina]
MKRLSFFILMALLTVSCSDSDDEIDPENPDLVGTWLLIEQYSDPGDGSGEYREVDSEKSIEFLEDGIFKSNGELCDLTIETGTNTSGTYVMNDTIVTQFSEENYLMPEECDIEDFKVYYHIEEGSLILSFPCIEGCGQKYEKK